MNKINVTFPNESTSVSVKIDKFNFKLINKDWIFEDVVFVEWDGIIVKISKNDYDLLLQKNI